MLVICGTLATYRRSWSNLYNKQAMMLKHKIEAERILLMLPLNVVMVLCSVLRQCHVSILLFDYALCHSQTKSCAAADQFEY